MHGCLSRQRYKPKLWFSETGPLYHWHHQWKSSQWVPQNNQDFNHFPTNTRTNWKLSSVYHHKDRTFLRILQGSATILKLTYTKQMKFLKSEPWNMMDQVLGVCIMKERKREPENEREVEGGGSFILGTVFQYWSNLLLDEGKLPAFWEAKHMTSINT